MKHKRSLAKFLGVWVAPIVGLSALALALFVYFYKPGQRAVHLSFTAGQKQTTRHQVAQALNTSATSLGIHLQLQETPGSEEALDQVNAGQLDLALVQGGLRVEDRPNVRQVATLNLEPLHLLVKKELHESVSKHLNALDGKTVNLGKVGSGTNSLAEEVLAFVGMRCQQSGKEGGYIATTLGQSELYAEKDRAKLPDAVFVVSALPSELCKFLVIERDYRLVPLPFGEAFSLYGLAVSEAGSIRPVPGGRVEKERVRAVIIPAFTYQVEPPVPDGELPVLGAHLLLVAHKDVRRSRPAPNRCSLFH